MELNAVRTIKIVARSEGLDQQAAKLHGIADAQQAVAVSSDTMTRRQTSAARSFATLTAQVDPAARAQQQFSRAQAIADRALQQAVITQNEHARVVEQARQKYLGMVPANENVARSTGLARYELINLSRQIQDVGVSLAGGQSPFTVLAQQGTQIADIFATSNGSLRGFAGQVLGLITPMRALALGTVAVGAAAFAAVSFWKSYALQLDDTARVSGMATAELAKLQAVATVKGVGSEDFAAGMKTFATSVYEARTGTNDLSKLLRANGQSVGDTATTFERVADLIKNAASDQQRLSLLQQAGLPATAEFLRLMEGGAEGIRKAKEQAASFGGVVNSEMVAKARQFDEAWTRAWENFKLGTRSSIVDAMDYFDRLIDKARASSSLIDKGVGWFDQATGGKTSAQTVAARFPYANEFRTTGTTVDPREVEKANARDQARIGVLGDLATIADQVRQKEIEIYNARQAGAVITKTEEEALKTLAASQALGTFQIREQTNALLIETATIGMSVGAAAAYRAELELIMAARLRGKPLDEEAIAALRREAQARGEAARINAESQLQDRVRFDRDTIGLSQSDLAIAREMKQIYGNEWQAHMNDSVVGHVRMTGSLRDQLAKEGRLDDKGGPAAEEEGIGNVVRLRTRAA